MASTVDQRMGAFDAVMWNVEDDPILRSVIVVVLVLDMTPDIATATERIERMSLAVPKLRERVVGNPISMVPPRWEVDPNFDLTYHLRWVAAPWDDGTLRPALALAETMAEQDFDRKRPLWEITLMSGLPDGRAALLVKIHHSITDGLGGLAMAASLLDVVREPDVDSGPMPPPPTSGIIGLPRRLTSGVTFEARRLATTSRAAVSGLGGVMVRTVRRPGTTVSDTADFLASAGRLLAPASRPESPLMTERSLSAHFDHLDCDLDDLKRAAKANAATLNDAFMTVVVRGLRRYHRGHGAPVTGLRVNMPVNLRTDEDATSGAEGGNRWVPARVVVPVDVADPAEHMQTLHPVLMQARTEPALVISDQVYRLLVRLPSAAATAVSAGLMKGTDVAATNLPGPPVPVYFAGAQVLGMLPFAPRAGSSLNVAMMTYAGRAAFAINIDERAVGEPEALVDDIRAALDEVIATAAT